MVAARLLLGCVAVAAFALSVFAFDEKPDPLERTIEYQKSTHVFHGTVAKLTLLDAESKPDSNGTRYTLDLTLAAVLKPEKQDKLKKGDVVAIRGRTTDGKVKYDLPAEKADVIAFVTKNKAGKYESLEPKGFRAVRGGGRGPGPSPGAIPIVKPKPPEKEKDKDKPTEKKDK